MLPRRLFNKSSICPRCLVSMETEAFIVFLPALSGSVCFFNNPVWVLLVQFDSVYTLVKLLKHT